MGPLGGASEGPGHGVGCIASAQNEALCVGPGEEGVVSKWKEGERLLLVGLTQPREGGLEWEGAAQGWSQG